MLLVGLCKCLSYASIHDNNAEDSVIRAVMLSPFKGYCIDSGITVHRVLQSIPTIFCFTGLLQNILYRQFIQTKKSLHMYCLPFNAYTKHFQMKPWVFIQW